MTAPILMEITTIWGPKKKFPETESAVNPGMEKVTTVIYVGIKSRTKRALRAIQKVSSESCCLDISVRLK